MEREARKIIPRNRSLSPRIKKRENSSTEAKYKKICLKKKKSPIINITASDKSKLILTGLILVRG